MVFKCLYGVCLFISMVVLIYMAQKNYKNLDVYYWSMVILIPVILVGYWFKVCSSSIGEAKLALCITYLDSTILLVLMIFSMLRAVNLKVSSRVKIFAYIAAFAHLLLVWACKDNTLYYATVELITNEKLGSSVLVTDGPLKIVHYLYLGAIVLSAFGIIIYGYVKKGTYSRRTLLIYTSATGIGIFFYSIEIFFTLKFSFLPCVYAVIDVLIAAFYDYYHSYDIDSMIIQQRQNDEEVNLDQYVEFSFSGKFRGCTEQAKELIPELKNLIVDQRIPDNETRLKELFYDSAENFENGRKFHKTEFRAKMKWYRITVSTYSARTDSKKLGYLYRIADITEFRHRNEIQKFFNKKRMEEAAQKYSKRIQKMQKAVVIGLADFIETRDETTGGHVKRTSDVMRILIDEIVEKGIYEINPNKGEDIVRSAPMHDLGKLDIDNSILKKPGKLTDEEFEQIKTHAEKSGQIVKAILSEVEEPEFVATAYRLARYHHEKWNGKGYPEGLKEEEIPIEARIMAVADVYDALVSKRSYKDELSPEAAADIILKDMGIHFDPVMKEVFENCREKIEDYYKSLKTE